MKPRTVIGITGTIASGKSLVGQLLEERGFSVIDTDKIVHNLLASNRSVIEQIKAIFGTTVIADDGSIDRRALGKIVFADDAARKSLEAIVHPATIKETQNKINMSPGNYVFILVPLLFEAGLEHRYNQIWTVFADDEVVKSRLRLRDKLTDEEIESRLLAQFPQATKRERSHKSINNSNSVEDTKRQLDKLITELTQNS